MTDAAISVHQLGKRYRLGMLHRSNTLRDTLVDAFRRRPEQNKNRNNILWALKDVSFDIRQGEAVGIIGRNGAGKSTLLKLLARITRPTEGSFDLYGRVGSLLEVGTGFHSELSGRDNIYLSGAILGMSRAEITRKFDEIVAFSEISKFIDTPVKRYSSGMYVRLAFAVAAHLEPEILLVDEVLAVGDLAFQKKCLGKMDEVAGQGRTVLFVSHNMATIKSLCQTGIYLESGQLKYQGGINECVNLYLSSGQTEAIPLIQLPEDTTLPAQLLSVRVVNPTGELATHQPFNQPFTVEVQLRLRERLSQVYTALNLFDSENNLLLLSRDFESDENLLLAREPGLYTFRVPLPASLLVPGTYRLSVHLVQQKRVMHGVDSVCPFEIVDDRNQAARHGFPWRGKLSVPLQWNMHRAEE